jgi:GTP-binding protein HflX
LLIGAPRRGTSEIVYAEDHLDELARLADTAGAAIAGRIIQRIHAPTSNYYLGHGKVEQLKRLAKERDATLAVFDEELSPVQGKNLERELDLRVMDRSELILDIFATRARSKEAKLEVELAQLEYLLPRLARMWVHLSRIRGGIGLRGPGETQLETDRRMIRRKISRLKAKLAKVERHREVVRSGRRPIPTAALVGYTNAGKSSLLRALSGANTFVEDRLFATLDTLTREMSLGNGTRLRLIDTVGFIRKLPHHLVASFRATLTEAAQADVLCHVIDAAHPRWDEQADVVDEVLGGLSLDSQPLLHVFNKMDRVAEPEALETRVTARYEHAVLVSAIKREVGPLVDKLRVLANGIPEEPKRAQPRVG